MNFFLKQKDLVKIFFKRDNAYYIVLIVIFFSIDRYSKINIINHFNESTYYINDFINLNLIWNTGVGFGLLSSTTTIFYNTITILIGLVILILSFIGLTSNKLEKIIFSIIVGGAVGNFYDRIVFKAVPDFIDLHYNSFHWFTFNLADIFITAGLIILLIKGPKKKTNDKT